MSFDEFQLIFTSGNQQCADQVWTQIKDKPIAFEGKVIQVGIDNLKLAATYDDIQNNVADVDIDFPVNIPAALRPKEGEMAQVQGNPTTYDANPFMIHMKEGAFVGKKAAAAAAAAAKGKSTRGKTTPHKKK